ncbi:hypothetical protein MN210_13660 [Psychrobacter raelei]|uniref:Uncharacterized protein n=1 Tax=Psychrobacter raelei TaxID=2565531 RepID=A0AAT9PDJ5_9GAMM
MSNNMPDDKNFDPSPLDLEKENSSTDNVADSVADNVDIYLQTLENSSRAAQRRQLSPEEQLFTEDELARLVNPDKLKALMSNGDDFLGYLTGEINKFED